MGYEEDGTVWLSPEEWFAEDLGDPGYEILSDDEIIVQVNGNVQSSSESDSSVCTVSHDMAHEAFAIVFEWLEAEGADYVHLLLVKNWMEIAAKKCCFLPFMSFMCS